MKPALKLLHQLRANRAGSPHPERVGALIRSPNHGDGWVASDEVATVAALEAKCVFPGTRISERGGVEGTENWVRARKSSASLRFFALQG